MTTDPHVPRPDRPDPDDEPGARPVPLDPDGDPRAIERVVLAAVAATGEPFEVIEVDPALADTAAFCAHYGYPPEISGNCIVVASKDDPPVLVACLALATTKLDVNSVVRRRLGVRKASFAPAPLTRAATGMEIGGVTPFGLPTDLPLWVDERIAALDRVIVGGGSRSIKLLVTPAALAASGAVFVTDLARPL
jgi:prolyl-tRNA editing enzyme YbaK/EbsC (Cys-tRNA(Pro) deacylase)